MANAEIERPFWAAVARAPWLNVDVEMKEAIDARDNNQRDAAFNATKAVLPPETTQWAIESAMSWIKVIVSRSSL